MEKTHNGLEMLLTSQLLIDLFDNYKVKGLTKNYGNMFVKELEKATIKSYNEVYANDPEFTTNSLKIKNRMINQIASLNEADAILFSEFLNKFINNIDIARKKGVVFFDKLL